VFALGQRLRHFVDYVTTTAGAANGEHVRRWFQDKKAGWYAVLADAQMPATSTLLDQAHNAIDRKLFMMKGFHHPKGSQQAFLTGLAHLYNLIPYQRRALNAGKCGWKWKAGDCPPQTGCSICRSSPRAASAERGCPLPHNSVECVVACAAAQLGFLATIWTIRVRPSRSAL
jgi:hypothetical protein